MSERPVTRPVAARRAMGPAAALLLSITILGLPVAAGGKSAVPGRRSPEELRRGGFRPLFDGRSLWGWDVKPWHKGHWVARDGIIDYDGKAQHKRSAENTLWTTAEYGDFVLYVEWRLPAEPTMKPHPIVLYNGDFLRNKKGRRITRPRLDAGDSGILMRGTVKCQVNLWCQELGSGEIHGYRADRRVPQKVRRACIPIRRADRPFGEWNALAITLRGNSMTVVLNGQTVIDAVRLPNLPARGRIGLQHHGDPIQFRAIFIKPLP